jgi:hypothetical protein
VTRGRREDAQWRIAFEMLAPMKPDDLMPYQALCEAYDTDDLHKVQRMVMRANQDLLSECGRKVVAVPEIGYRMIRAAEHVTHARRHELASRRQLSRAVEVIESTRVNELTPAQKESVAQLGMIYRGMVEAFDYHEERLNEHDSMIAKLQRGQDELRAQVDFLKINQAESE